MKNYKLFLPLLLLLSCESKTYRYEIRGQVYVPTSGPNPVHKAIWYTDTISFDHDTIYYFNSNGYKVKIFPPYKIIDTQHDNR